MPREYRHIQKYEKEILELRELENELMRDFLLLRRFESVRSIATSPTATAEYIYSFNAKEYIEILKRYFVSFRNTIFFLQYVSKSTVITVNIYTDILICLTEVFSLTVLIKNG